MIKIFTLFLFTVFSLSAMTKEEIKSAVAKAWKSVPEFPELMPVGNKYSEKQLAEMEKQFSKDISQALNFSKKLLTAETADKSLLVYTEFTVGINEIVMAGFNSQGIEQFQNFSMASGLYSLLPKMDEFANMSVKEFLKIGQEEYRKMESVKDRKADLELKVLGRQWDWIFTYPDGSQVSCHESKKKGPDGKPLWSPLKFDASLKDKAMDQQLVCFATIPVNKMIRLRLKGEKVLHCLAIPAFRVKKDASPKKESVIWFKPVKEGTYIYTCNEMCGIDHGSMIGYLRVVSEKEYKRFLKALKSRKKAE